MCQEQIDEIDINDVTTNVSAFIPFSFGPANCAGKNLAMLEMRCVICALMQKFDMKFGVNGNDRDNSETWDEGLNDYFMFQVGKLMVRLTRRN